MKHSSQIRRRGMSLPEVMISSLLVGIVVVGALKVIGGAVQTRRLNAGRLDGPKLTEELWSEIMAQPYEDPESPGGPLGLESGEAAPRSNFDDVDDYVGWSKSPPVDATGAALTAYNGWTREVFVARTSRDKGDDFAASDTGLKRFLVRVTSPGAKVYERQGLRWKNGAIEEPLAIDSTVVTELTSELQIGGQTNLQTATSNLINHADSP